MPFEATWMDLEIITLSEVSQTEKDKYYIITCMWNLKINANELIYKIETDFRHRKQTYGCQSGKRGEEG